MNSKLNCFITKQQLFPKTPAKTQGTQPQSTVEKEKNETLDVDSIAADYARVSLENANKIKELTEKLDKLKLSAKPTKDEIDNYVAQINSMRTQANELYDSMNNFNYQIGCKERDELFAAYRNFDNLAQKKLAEADIAKQQANGLMSGRTMLKYMETYYGMNLTPKTSQPTTTKTETETEIEKNETLDVDSIAADYAKVSLENANKIKELTEKLDKLKLSAKPTKDEIDNYVAQINSMRTQANELYDSMNNFNYQIGCKERDELVAAYRNFDKLAQEKLAKADTAKLHANGLMRR